MKVPGRYYNRMEKARKSFGNIRRVSYEYKEDLFGGRMLLGSPEIF